MAYNAPAIQMIGFTFSNHNDIVIRNDCIKCIEISYIESKSTYELYINDKEFCKSKDFDILVYVRDVILTELSFNITKNIYVYKLLNDAIESEKNDKK